MSDINIGFTLDQLIPTLFTLRQSLKFRGILNVSGRIKFNALSHHYKTIRLFLKGDLHALLLPWTLFGVANALSAHVLGVNQTASTIFVLTRLPLIAVWVVANILPCCISNQRHPAAIREDKINKPWRPIASGRITAQQADRFLIISYLVAYLISHEFGGRLQCVALAVLTYFYNDLGGADKSWITRYLLNGLGFVNFGTGAMEVALSRSADIGYSRITAQWISILVLVIATGMQSMDLYDVKGDTLIGRRTLPILIGDTATRWTITMSVISWSLFCPWYWGLGLTGYAVPSLGAIYTSVRYFIKRNPKSDKTTYRMWHLWLLSMYCLPLLKTYGL